MHHKQHFKFRDSFQEFLAHEKKMPPSLLDPFSCFFFSDKFFDMPKKECKAALDLYKKFLIKMEKVAEFLKVAEVYC